MNIALCHFRVGETDGVSLEMEKWKQVLIQMGHRVYFLSGSDTGEDSFVIDELHYQHPENNKFVKNAYGKLEDYNNEKEFEEDVLQFTHRIERKLDKFLDEYEVDVLVPNNIWSLGWGLPAGIAFANVTRRRSIRCIAHHHDFYWERDRYSKPTCNFVRKSLENFFPPQSETIQHVVINKIAQQELRQRTGLNSIVVPNVFDFNEPAWDIDEYNSNLRKDIGIKNNDILVLQATRIAERKAIELALDVVGEMQKLDFREKLARQRLYDTRQFDDNSDIVFVCAGLPESTPEYLNLLKDKAAEKNIKIKFINDVIKVKRSNINEKKNYSLWDVYAHADLITYPSVLEGWGNQFLEAVFAKKPIVVYEYPVYETDIKKHGFSVISLGNKHLVSSNGLLLVSKKVLEQAAQAVIPYLTDAQFRKQVVDNNEKIARHRFSFETLGAVLGSILTPELAMDLTEGK